MQRLALALALGSVLAAALPSPGLFIAMGLGIAAIGTGWVGFAQRSAAGFRRLGGAAAIALGSLGLVLGVARIALVLLAIDRVDAMLG